MDTKMFNDSAVLELAGRVMQNIADGEAKAEALKNEMISRMDIIQKEVHTSHKEIWAEIYAATGVDPEGDYRLDTQYLKLGIVFIEDKPKQEESMSDMLKRALGEGQGESVSLHDILSDALAD